MRWFPILFLLALACQAKAEPALGVPGARLERVVIVTRHGVRPPTQDNAALGKLSAEPWPEWPAPPGELTPHGEAGIAAMGKALRAAYPGLAGRGAACPPSQALAVWADASDQRTRKSGEALAAALAPGCGVASRHAAEKRDPIFSGLRAPACPFDPEAGRRAILDRAGPGGLSTPAAQAGLKRLQSIVAPEGCKGGLGVCLEGEDAVRITDANAALTGPLSSGAGLAEDLLLEYAEGMPAAKVGWGRADAAAIGEALAVHERTSDLTRATPYLAARRGGAMGAFVLDALTEPAPAAGDGPGMGRAMTVLAGHDTNLSNMAGVFGLSWRLPGQPDTTAPATALAFELWAKPDGTELIRPVVYSLSLEGLRHPETAKVSRSAVAVEGCQIPGMGGICPVAAWRAKLDTVVPAGCRKP